MTYAIVVSGQTCTKYDRRSQIASSSIEFVDVVFQLPSEWANFQCVAQFAQNDKYYNKVLVDGKCKLPNELTAGQFSVSVFGYEAGRQVRGTTIPLVDTIGESGFLPDVGPIPPTPDLYAQLLEKINQTEATTGEYADAAKQSADAAKASKDEAAKSAADAAEVGLYAKAALSAKEAAEAASDDAQAAARAAKASENAVAESASNAAKDAAKAASAAKKAADESVAANIAAIEKMQSDVASKQTATAASEKAAAASAVAAAGSAAQAETLKTAAAQAAEIAQDAAESLQPEVNQIKDDLSKKQDALVSGQNIKTLNGQSILGSGNIETSGAMSQNILDITLDQDVSAWIYTGTLHRFYIFVKFGEMPEQYSIVLDALTDSGYSIIARFDNANTNYSAAANCASINGLHMIQFSSPSLDSTKIMPCYWYPTYGIFNPNNNLYSVTIKGLRLRYVYGVRDDKPVPSGTVIKMWGC